MLTLTGVRLRRGPRILFDNADCRLDRGQRVGITGANGTGKSSLFALIEGALDADAGELELAGEVVIASVAQEVEAVADSALEYVLAGDRELMLATERLSAAEAADDGAAMADAHAMIEQIDGYTAPSRAARLLSGLGFNESEQSRSFAEFSGGWRMRLNLARALMCRSDLLLLDEPTNHLDLDAIIWLESWLAEYRGLLLVISHDRDFLDAVCTRIVHIEAGRVTLSSGNYSDFEQQRAARLAVQQAAFRKQQREIERMEKFVERFRAKATKARQAQSRLKTLARLTRIAPAHVDSPYAFEFVQPGRMPTELISVRGGCFGYNNTAVLSNVRLAIAPGDRIGLLGVNGAGKSTLIRALAGELAPMDGTVERARDLRVAYFAQHQVEQLRADETPLGMMKRLYARTPELELRKHLGAFAFPGDSATAPIGPLSGGEKARLVLAAIVRRQPNLLLLDEPTNHLDLEMRHALGLALQSYEGALVLVSHDRYLLQSVSDSLQFVNAGTVAEFTGDLDDYAQALLATRSAGSQADRPAAPAAHSAQQKRERRRAEAAARQRVSGLRRTLRQSEQAVEETAEKLAALHEQLGDSALYADDRQEEVRTLLREQTALRQQLAANEALWLETSEALEQVEGVPAAAGEG